MTDQFHDYFMRLALRQAKLAMAAGETPTGCLIVIRPQEEGGLPAAARVLGRAFNQVESLRDPTAHAEMIAITQAAAALGDWRLVNTVLYVTKEPCPMCAGAIINARIPTVVFGARDPRRGGMSVFGITNHPALNHRAECVGGIMESECSSLLRMFFRERRGDCRLPHPNRDENTGAKPLPRPRSSWTGHDD